MEIWFGGIQWRAKCRLGAFAINIVLFPPGCLLPEKKVTSIPGSTGHVWGVLPTSEHKKSALTEEMKSVFTDLFVHWWRKKCFINKLFSIFSCLEPNLCTITTTIFMLWGNCQQRRRWGKYFFKALQYFIQILHNQQKIKTTRNCSLQGSSVLMSVFWKRLNL